MRLQLACYDVDGTLWHEATQSRPSTVLIMCLEMVRDVCGIGGQLVTGRDVNRAIQFFDMRDGVVDPGIFCEGGTIMVNARTGAKQVLVPPRAMEAIGLFRSAVAQRREILDGVVQEHVKVCGWNVVYKDQATANARVLEIPSLIADLGLGDQLKVCGYSDDANVDVMLSRFGKEHIRGYLPAKVLFACDGDNDTLLANREGVIPLVVGNAGDRLKRLARVKGGMIASASYGDGVVEGLLKAARRGLLPNSAEFLVTWQFAAGVATLAVAGI